ncbi:hypothetical protein [Nitrosomonas sp. Nm33]|uniref:hypothetical protein n=1 Tax=Nitrosomonas sp. Nm33 TaxID=133724 RepID=UPI000B8A38DD|nr:hypothetical protein [Nitrosomonas sp. Nm33]
MALEEQWRRVEEEQIDLDKIGSGRFSDLQLPLPNRRGELVSVAFHFRPGNVLNSSSGGTGTLMVQISGFFEILTTHHSGPSKVFHLKEFDAPLTLRAKFLNRS